MTDVSKAGKISGAGNWVTPVRPSPDPAGPSSNPNCGMHKRGVAGTSPA